MKITYTGKQDDLNQVQRTKLETRFLKVSKLLDSRKGEKEAHVVLTSERHLNHAEITVRYYDHAMVGEGSDADLFTAISTAVDKLEKQILRQREKWRDTKRGPKELWEEEGAAEPGRMVTAEIETHGGDERKQVFRVNHHEKRKPMTLEEALLVMEKDRDYLVYRDAETEGISVLVRRRDGNFDLIEA